MDQFQTPATRRSPVQFGTNKNQPRSKGKGFVTKAFEDLRPYATQALSDNMAWLEDDICSTACNELGVVMPPVGYEADTRTFRHFSENLSDKEDIYDTVNYMDQGTVASTMDKETEKSDNLNEFGFGYRNGHVYNEANKHTPDSLLYITHKHHTMDNLLTEKRNTPKSQVNERGRGRQQTQFQFQTRQQPLAQSAHKYDAIDDVTTTTTRRARSGGNRPTFGMDYVNDEDNSNITMSTGGNNDNNSNSNNASQFSFNSNAFAMGSGQTAMDIEDSKEDTNSTASGPNPMAWTSKFPIFSQPEQSTGERRRESFVSGYSNYTPDGPKGTGARQKPLTLTYT